mmetsp:Transcript_22582/g.35772  ORF Transcript_22582/g.35772 Transcript_22582/m.35772 type:complete len:189 (-) Transcript_22582:34-600(-)
MLSWHSDLQARKLTDSSSLSSAESTCCTPRQGSDLTSNLSDTASESASHHQDEKRLDAMLRSRLYDGQVSHSPSSDAQDVRHYQPLLPSEQRPPWFGWNSKRPSPLESQLWKRRQTKVVVTSAGGHSGDDKPAIPNLLIDLSQLPRRKLRGGVVACDKAHKKSMACLSGLIQMLRDMVDDLCDASNTD